MRPLMDFERFKHIMTLILDFDEKRSKISDFFENNLCTGSYCIFDFGSDIQEVAINMLADEFDCWYDTGQSFPSHLDEQAKEWWEAKYSRFSNDIVYWLYDAPKDNKTIGEADGTETKINTLEELYEYLVKSYNQRNLDLENKKV